MAVAKSQNFVVLRCFDIGGRLVFKCFDVRGQHVSEYRTVGSRPQLCEEYDVLYSPGRSQSPQVHFEVEAICRDKGQIGFLVFVRPLDLLFGVGGGFRVHIWASIGSMLGHEIVKVRGRAIIDRRSHAVVTK